MSDPDTGRGIPEAEQFSTSAERAEFSRAVNFDPTVKKAMADMEIHDIALQGKAELQPESAMDALIDELLAEQKKEQPNPDRLDDIRRRLDREHVVVMAQSVTTATAEQHMSDRRETQELDDREEAIRDISVLVDVIPGLKQDIYDMADNALGEAAEEYPSEMQNIFDMVDSEIENAAETVAKTFGDIEPSDVEERLRDQTRLQQFDFETLRMVDAYLVKAKVKLIEEHTSMLKVTSEWREKHKQT